jgi:hypothetical protein
MNGQPCTYQACVDRCTKSQLSGWKELRFSGKRCACTVPAACSRECESSICAGNLPDQGSTCERCMIKLALKPPEDCGMVVCIPGGACAPRTLCDLHDQTCEALIGCWKDCPAAP